MTTAWRDIADQLAPGQIDELASLELEIFKRGLVDRKGTLLSIARSFATGNLAATVLSDVSEPAGALTVGPWEGDRGDDPTWSRCFTGTTREVGPASVVIGGEQFSDGRCQRWLSVRNKRYGQDSSELTPAQARELEGALHDAADEVDEEQNNK
jgi:hypothetical protein